MNPTPFHSARKTLLFTAITALTFLLSSNRHAWGQAPEPVRPPPPPSYLSIIGDGTARASLSGTVGSSGSGALGIDLQVPTFGLYFAGQYTAATSLEGDRKKLANTIVSPNAGTGGVALDVRIQPGGDADVNPFVRALGIALLGNFTGFRWNYTVDGVAKSSEDIYNIAWGAAFSYRLDLVAVAQRNKVNMDRSQDINFSVNIGYTGRYILGDRLSFADAMAENGGDKIPALYQGFDIALMLQINKTRFFLSAPTLFSNVEGLSGTSVIVGGGVRGDVYRITDRL